MGPLDRKRLDRVTGHAIMATGERDPLAFEQPLDDGDRLCQPFDPRASRVESQPRLVVFGLDAPRAQAELKPPLGKQVDRRRLARDQHGMAQVVIEHVRADPKISCRLGSADQCRHRRHKIGEMIGNRQGVVTQILNLASRLGQFDP